MQANICFGYLTATLASIAYHIEKSLTPDDHRHISVNRKGPLISTSIHWPSWDVTVRLICHEKCS